MIIIVKTNIKSVKVKSSMARSLKRRIYCHLCLVNYQFDVCGSQPLMLFQWENYITYINITIIVIEGICSVRTEGNI